MILSEIIFFVKCAKELKQIHKNVPDIRKRQLETFLKTWLFYNSHTKAIFWTGNSSINGLNERVKEHQYSNLSSVKYIMNGNFFDLCQKDQFISVFKFMQWNYTSKDENYRLRPHQEFNVFYGDEICGDPNMAYQLAQITLREEANNVNILPRLNTFFEHTNEGNGLIFEIDLTNNHLTNFINYLNIASEQYGILLNVIQFSKKGCIFRLINNTNNFSDLYRVTMFSLWKCFSNANELTSFLTMYQYSIGENGPYRNINNFEFDNRAFEIQLANGIIQIVYIDTYNGTPYKFDLISKILDFFDATCVVYDFKLNQQYPNISLD